MRDCGDWAAACVPNPQRTYVIPTTPSVIPGVYAVIPATHPRHSRALLRHSRVGGNLDAVCVPKPAGHRPRVLPASVSLSAALLRLSRGAGAEDGGACGDEEAAGKEKHEQQAA